MIRPSAMPITALDWPYWACPGEGGARREGLRGGRAGGGEAVIAVEFAHDLHDAVARLEVVSRHRAVGDEQRLVEAAHLQRQKLGGRLGRAASEKRADISAHAALAHAVPRRNIGDRHAAVQEADDPHLALGLPSARRASPAGERSRRRASGAASTGSDKGAFAVGRKRTNIEQNTGFGKKLSHAPGSTVAYHLSVTSIPHPIFVATEPELRVFTST